MNVDLLKHFKAARKCSVPILAISSPDQTATIRALSDTINGTSPVFRWDVLSGFQPMNKPAADSLHKLKPSDSDESEVGSLTAAVNIFMTHDIERAILFIINAHRFLDDTGPMQAVANCRDALKADGRTLILLGAALKLPVEIAGDVVLLDEPLPTAEQLTQIVKQSHEDEADLRKRMGQPDRKVTKAIIEKAVEAVQGLPAFQVEQAVALSLVDSEPNLDLHGLWERKRSQIEQTPGLKVWRGGERFDSIGGCDVIKGFVGRILKGNGRPNAIVFIDEIEKMFAGAGGDTSGVTQDQLGTLLSYMQDNNASGMILIGPPGSGKSAIAKAAGNEGGIPTIQLDLGASKGSLVGSSEAAIRNALKVITAVSNSKSLWVATCMASDTIVTCADGALLPISEVAHRHVVSCDMKQLGTIATRKVDAYVAQEKPTIRIITTQSELIVTREHRFFRHTAAGFEEIEASRLSAGDFIASSRVLPHGANKMNLDEAYLLGYTTGDGCYSCGRLSWSEETIGHAAYVAALWGSMSGKVANIHKHSMNKGLSIYATGKHADTFADRYACVVSKTPQRSCPIEISISDAETVAAYLQGLFDADGCITNEVIEFCTISRLLAHQVSALLRRFGILYSLNCTWKTKANNRIYKMNLAGQQAINFIDCIGFRMHRKNALAKRLRKVLAARKKTSRSVDAVPIDVDAMRESSECPMYFLVGSNRPKLSRRETVNAYIRQAGHRSIGPLAIWEKFHWERIRCIEEAGIRTVCDITVPEEHTFLAAATITHNCNKIADLPPELRRRFTLGTFYFDLPTKDERGLIWDIHRKRLGLANSEAGKQLDDIDDEGWTGAEIRQCVDIAWRLDCSLKEAAAFVVPIAKSAADSIDKLRAQADGKFLSASYPGTYKRKQPEIVKSTRGRQFNN